MDIVSTHECYNVEFRDRVPTEESHRRRLIRERLEDQLRRWRSVERQRWYAITQPGTVSYLGLPWSEIQALTSRHIKSDAASFAILSELQLSTISPVIASSETELGYNWLYEQYCKYAISVYDFGNQVKEYQIPVIELVAVPTSDSPYFEAADPHAVSTKLPTETATCRLITFPQTRFSFIEDEVFHGLYPLPEEEVKVMSSRLQNVFQGPQGYYNGLANPSTDIFDHQLYNGKQFRFLATQYPVIVPEFAQEYERRKRSERCVSMIQQQSVQSFPTITQFKYARRFDLAEESLHQSYVFADQDSRHCMQSARGLFEYSCGELDTLGLDLQQISLIEHESREPRHKCLLQVGPLWLIVFPYSNTVCAFRNVRMAGEDGNPSKQFKIKRGKVPTWGHILLNVVNAADCHMGSYESTYRRRLAKLQFRIHRYTRDHGLIKDLSGFVTEITTLLDPLQAQITIIQKWREWCQNDGGLSSDSANLFAQAIGSREAHFESLKVLQGRAKESQSVLFQLSNIEIAHQQSELAKKMAQETTRQVELADKADRQNKAILIFTVVTVVFLPLSFFTSYFGMDPANVKKGSKSLFWSVSGPVSFAVVSFALAIAFRSELERIFCSSNSRSLTSEVTTRNRKSSTLSMDDGRI